MWKSRKFNFLTVGITGILIGTFSLIPAAFAGISTIEGRVSRTSTVTCGKRKFYIGGRNNVHQIKTSVESANLMVMAKFGVETDLAIFFLDDQYNFTKCYDGAIGLPPSVTLPPGRYLYIVGASIDSNNTTPPYISNLTW